MNTSGDDEDEAAEARQYAAQALRVLADIAYNPNADPADQERARKILETWLLDFKRLREDPSLSPDLRRDIENTLRKFRQS